MNTTQRLTAYAMQSGKKPTPAQRRRLIKKARVIVLAAARKGISDPADYIAWHAMLDDRLWATGGPSRAA